MLFRNLIGIILLTLPSAIGHANANSLKIADGSKVQVPERGFSMTPPKGWEYRTDLPNLSLFAQAPKEKGGKYQRTIQVMVRNTPVTIDESTAKTVEEELIKVFGQGVSGVTEFHVRNHEIVEMSNQTKGVLYYTGMKLDGLDLMQIHVLTSSDKKHYVSTFTDLAVHFDKGTDSPVLMTAWESLSSMEVQGVAPRRFEAPITVFGIIGAIFGIGLLISGIRYFASARQYRRLTKDLGSDSEESGDGESLEATGMPAQSRHTSQHPTSGVASFQGSSEVTKASAHMANITIDETDLDDDQWNLGNTKGKDKAS